MRSILGLLVVGLTLVTMVRINVSQAKEEIIPTNTSPPVKTTQQNYLSIPPTPNLLPIVQPTPTPSIELSQPEPYLITYYSCSSAEGTERCVTFYGKALFPGVVASNSLAEGTNVEIEGLGHFTVGDRGGGLGYRHLDVYVTSRGEALQRGREYRNVQVRVNR